MFIPGKRYHFILEVLSILFIIGLLAFFLFSWGSIPDKLPGHYNAMGQIDRMTGKGHLIINYSIMLIMYLGMSILERFPQAWNTGVRVTKENRIRVYSVLKSMIKTIKFILVATFTYIILSAANEKALSWWFTPGILILTFGTLAYFLIKLYRNR